MNRETAMTTTSLLLLGLLPSPANAAPAGDLLAAVPQDAFFVASTDEWDALRGRASKNRWVEFFQDEEWDPVWELVRSNDELRELIDGDLDLEAALDSIHGRVVVFAAGPDVENVAAGLLVEPGEDRAEFEELYDGLVERMAAERAPGYGDYQDVELTFFEDEEGATQVHFELEGLFAQVHARTSEVAVEAAHGVIDRYRGGEQGQPGFEANTLRPRAREGLPAAPAAWGFADVQQIVALAMAEEDEVLEPEEREMLEHVGVFGIGWLYAQAELGAGEELALRVRVEFPSDTLLGDLLGHLGTLPTEMLDLMPRGATSVTLGNYDLWGAYQTAKSFLEEYVPELHMQLDGGLTMLEASMQIDLEADFLSQLSGRFGSFRMPVSSEELRSVTPTLPEGTEALNQGDVTLVGLTNSERVQAVVSKVLQLVKLDTSVETEEYQGRPFSVLPLPTGPRLHWAFAERALAVGLYPTPLRAVLARSGDADAPTVRDDEAFAARIAAVKGASMAQVSDTATTVSMLLEAVPLIAQLGLQEGDVDEETAQALQRVEWPEPALAREYFSGTVESTVGRRGTVLEVVYAAR